MSDKLTKLTEIRAGLEKELALVVADIKAEKKSISKKSPSNILREVIKKQGAANDGLRASNKELRHFCTMLMRGNGATTTEIASNMQVSVTTVNTYIREVEKEINRIEYGLAVMNE